MSKFISRLRSKRQSTNVTLSGVGFNFWFMFRFRTFPLKSSLNFCRARHDQWAYASIVTGFSINIFKVCKKAAPVAPSTVR
jgi:hypothetical protein